MISKKISDIIEQRKGQRKQLQDDLSSLRLQRKKLKSYIVRAEEAKEILRAVGLQTQQQITYHISDIASLALESIFPDPYTLLLEFVKKRNKTECNIVFEKNGERLDDPLFDTGGGIADVSSFALRIASWSMQSPRSRNSVMLDEPFKFINGKELQERASDMIRQVSKKLNIQFIIVTNESDLAFHADKEINVKQVKGISKIY